jgi:alpha-tubulin suppressor-like RCC1 family protein
MSRQYPGGFISKNAPVVSPTSASGMWSMDQVGNYVIAGTWSGSQSPSSPAVGTVSLSTMTSSGSNWLITAAVPYTAPIDNGGAVITGYVATSSPGNLTGTIAQAGPGTITVVGIQPDVLYTFTVTASSAGGSSAPSASSNAVITSAAPTGIVASVSLTTASVSYVAPTTVTGTPITSYTATSSPGGFTGTLTQAGSGTITVSGLSAGTAYTFTVTATFASGATAVSSSSNSITAQGVPNAPTIGTASVLLTTASVPFTAPNDRGSTITSYTATSSPGGFTGTLTQAGSGSISVSGLTKGTAYTFTVKATNAIGASSASSASNSITALGVPNAPTIGTATVLLTTATVPFTAPSNNGGSAITSYTATSSPGGFTGTLTQADSGSISVSGLTKNTAYTFTVTATNAIGASSASSASNSITALGVSDAPNIGTATVLLTTATVPFTAPTNSGGSAITIYTATSSPGNLTGTISQAGSGSITVSGLTKGTAYTFTVKATNAIGTSSASAASNSITALGVADAPTIGTATVLLTTATVPFTAPSNNGGSAITSYTATSSPGNLTGTISQAGSGSISVTGLTKNTAYTFTVTATNTTGTSSGSAASNSVLALGVPNAPTIGTATVLLTTATVPFTAPSNNGGSAITSYTATSSPGGFTGTLTQADSGSISVSGLTKNTAYTFTVTATNVFGASTASAASNSVLALGVSDAPNIGTVTLSVATATVPFTAPANNGGSVVTSYTATSSPGGFTGTLTQAGSGSITVSGLTKGTAYTFTVKATNAIGASSASSVSTSVTTTTTPTAPTIGTATVLLTTATVPFTAPVSAGGETITSYTATSSPGGFVGTLTQAGSGSISVSGLTKNTAYTFTVTATNIWGVGTASSASNSITALGVSDAPTIGTATVSGTTATVPFTAPASNGGATITSYTATSAPGGFVGTLTQAGSGSITVSGLSANTAYTFTVTATNVIGTGTASAASNSITTANVPGAPTIGTATVSVTTATVPFTAPALNGGATITSYTATSAPGGRTGTLTQAGSGSITVSGLSANTAYTFTVTATNVVGTGTASAASNSITTANVPGAPTGVSATISLTTATVSYTAPASNGGATIIYYTATSSPGGANNYVLQAGSGSIPVYNLTKGTAYTFTVVAENGAGSSSASTTSNSVLAQGVPNAPTIGTVTSSTAASVTVPFTAPTNNGGSAITSYTATSSPGGLTGTLNQAGSGSITVSGLTNATAYTFTVTATNGIGTSSASSASNSITIGVLVSGSLYVWPSPPNSGSTGTVVATSVSKVSGATDVVAIVKTNGTLWVLGYSVDGGLGLGSTTTASVFTQVGTDTNWSNVWCGAAANYYQGALMAAIKTDGSLWVCGYNTYGGLGLNDFVSRSTLTQVAGTWSTMAVGVNAMYGVRSDGTLWGWGQVPIGSGSGTKSSPVQIAAGTWTTISTGVWSSQGIKSDNTFYTWGGEGRGMLGNGSSTGNLSVPTQLGTHTATMVACSTGAHLVGVIRSDNTLWMWGENGLGEVGDGTTTSRSYPVQVSSSSSWSKVSCGYATAAGIKTNGTLWIWGWGGGNSSVPIQAGSNSGWSAVACKGTILYSLAT